MIIKSASFLISNTDPAKCPPPVKPEYAFIGRSNVGKSSLINMLVNQKSLAKTSTKPGKTQLINHFLINNEWFLVDLPGYGFAKVGKDKKEDWQKMLENYLRTRKNLLCIFLLIDSRIPAQKIDLEFMEWLAKNQLAFAIVFTKADKLTKNEMHSNMAAYKKELFKSWEVLPPLFYTSSETRAGKEELLDYIEKTNELFIKP